MRTPPGPISIPGTSIPCEKVEEGKAQRAAAAMASAYTEEGWRVDNALMEAIAAAGTREAIIAKAADALRVAGGGSSGMMAPGAM